MTGPEKTGAPAPEKKSTPASGIYRKACLGASVFFVTVLMSVGVLSLILPAPSYSDYEKRELASFPEISARALWSGEWTRDFDAYYADTFPGRDGFIAAAAVLDDWKGIRGEEGIRIYNQGQGQTQPSSASSQAPASSGPAPEPESGGSSAPETSSSQSEAPPEVPDGYLTEGYCIVGDRGVTLFGGYRPVAEEYAGILTRFADRLEGKARVFNIVVPCSGEFYLPENYRSLSASQKENIDFLYGKLGESVTPVDAYSHIAAHTDEYLYFRTDHHWTTLGAYYAYEAYCQAAGLDCPDPGDFEVRSIPDFLGTVYSATRDAKLGEDPDRVDYYITAPDSWAELWLKGEAEPLEVFPWCEFSSGVNSYGVFIWADNPLFVMHNPAVTNGKSALVMKESYGNAFAPWLMCNYETVYVIDYRHNESSVYDFVLEKGIDDVIFINNSFAANTSYHADRIDYLCNRS